MISGERRVGKRQEYREKRVDRLGEKEKRKRSCKSRREGSGKEWRNKTRTYTTSQDNI